MPDCRLSRRDLIGGAAALLALPARAAAPADGRLAFGVFRNGVRIGEQEMIFARAGGLLTVTSHAVMLVKLGPVPVYRYDHQSKEVWRDGRVEQVDTTTQDNGKPIKVAARRTADGLAIETGKGRVLAPAGASPFSHWNPDIFAGPLFNPQTGALLKVTASRAGPGDVPDGVKAASRWIVRGAVSIDDWYDAAGVWSALRGELKDKSVMEYRPV